jgi:YebC/PmpR family DNA-binding regulatory protein
MSGHSKWATIKRKKGLKDAARGKLFTKLGREVLMAAQQGGSDPQTNFSLRLAVERARAANMTSDTITKLIQKASGQLKGEKIVEVTYEAYGPAGSMVLIDCQTDNTNRSVTDVKSTLNLQGGKLANAGSISWQFNSVGMITVAPQRELAVSQFGKEAQYESISTEELELILMELLGVVDIEADEEGNIQVITEKDEFRNVLNKLIEGKFKIIDSTMAQLTDNLITLTGEDLEKYEAFIEALENLDDVEQVWSNVNMNV